MNSQSLLQSNKEQNSCSNILCEPIFRKQLRVCGFVCPWTTIRGLHIPAVDMIEKDRGYACVKSHVMYNLMAEERKLVSVVTNRMRARRT